MTNGTINHKMLFGLAYTVFGALTVAIICVFAVFFYPFEPLKYEKVVLAQNQVAAGELIKYTTYFKKNVDKTGTMSRWLVCKNQATQSLDFTLADAQAGDTEKTVAVEIPKTTLPCQECKITWTVNYDYFGLRTVPTRYATPWFKILPKDK